MSTDDISPELGETAGATAPPVPSHAVRTFLFALSTDQGPKLLGFRVSNLLIGRLPDNHLALNHGSVSRRHAKISVTARGVVIEDMGSQNGTTVNGTAITGQHNIKPGDVLRIGYVPLFYFGFVQPENPPQMEIVQTTISLNPNAPPI
ncbi:MAG: FHA domain-containing protein [Candidatus Sumerlaeia bacterium]|nr:FHA domain-containing protein [Candidatus Sumerlaeia bacterium]